MWINLKHPVLAAVRWFLLVVFVVAVAVCLWRIRWYWGALWLFPGFILALNLVGFAMLPAHWLLKGGGAQRDRHDLESEHAD